ncbi:GNAT family N-acetyltransferase [Phycicoccus sonneratiae]|uniref:GNAT family N-acetyltransferase n=1 Tax=Phycicoccus sonneratiae TaxID=2807628 RepID=A0ABS2CHS1_9MICO|nr:GNAT family N-acetyltransferase [Phycicoccus sonneraticus]MBM6399424.1 GNAT family N-acetyltransferase [Phycicoccus sonneraticus]
MTVRLATDADLPLLGPLEDTGDRQFETLFGALDWPPADTGAQRAAEPGFLLVATEDDEVVGFAHVLDLDGHWHLEQLSVDPGHQRRGHGAALLAAVLVGAGARGATEVTLRTYADVPWNGPWYARHGWVEVSDPPWHATLLEGEARMRLAEHGRRIAMRRPVD